MDLLDPVRIQHESRIQRESGSGRIAKFWIWCTPILMMSIASQCILIQYHCFTMHINTVVCLLGVFCDGLIRCPWHGACFSVNSGDIEDFPGLDSIPKFDVC